MNVYLLITDCFTAIFILQGFRSKVRKKTKFSVSSCFFCLPKLSSRKSLFLSYTWNLPGYAPFQHSFPYTCFALSPYTLLDLQFQKQDLDPGMVSVHLETCKSSLNKIKNGEWSEFSDLKTLQADIDTSKRSYKEYRIDMTQEPATLLKKIVNKVLENIDDRFPQLDILSAFGILGIRPISFLGNDELCNWGKDKLNILISQYGRSKSHEYKCQGDEQRKTSITVEPFINPDNTRAEWDCCKKNCHCRNVSQGQYGNTMEANLSVS